MYATENTASAGEIIIYSFDCVRRCPADFERVLSLVSPDAYVISFGPLKRETAVASFSLPLIGPDGSTPDYSQSIHCLDCPRPEGCFVIKREGL